MARADTQMGKNALHRFPFAFVQRVRWQTLPILDQIWKPPRNLTHGQDKISKASRHRAARHRSVFGLFRLLNQDDASCFLHRLDANGAIRTGAGQDDGEVVAALRRERTKKDIDRGPLPPRLFKFGGRQMMVGDNKLPVGWNDIDVAWLNSDSARNLSHRHTGPRRKNVRKLALVAWVEMHDDDESGFHIVRQALEKHLQRVDTSR